MARIFALGWSFALLGACAADKATDTASGDPPTFTALRDDVFVPSCGFSSCHGSGTGGLTLDAGMTADALIDAPSTAVDGAVLVVPGDADGSYLVWKLEGADGIIGDEMPPGGSLPAETLADVRAWIDAGAAAD